MVTKNMLCVYKNEYRDVENLLNLVNLVELLLDHGKIYSTEINLENFFKKYKFTDGFNFLNKLS